jgi:hypothetical protein
MKAWVILRGQCKKVIRRSPVSARIRTVWFKEILVVPKKEALKKKILDEAHTSRYSIHLGSTKMYHDLRQPFLWTRIKHEAARYVSECDTCRKVKIDYMKREGLLQPLSIIDWK